MVARLRYKHRRPSETPLFLGAFQYLRERSFLGVPNLPSLRKGRSMKKTHVAAIAIAAPLIVLAAAAALVQDQPTQAGSGQLMIILSALILQYQTSPGKGTQPFYDEGYYFQGKGARVPSPAPFLISGFDVIWGTRDDGLTAENLQTTLGTGGGPVSWQTHPFPWRK